MAKRLRKDRQKGKGSRIINSQGYRTEKAIPLVKCRQDSRVKVG